MTKKKLDITVPFPLPLLPPDPDAPKFIMIFGVDCGLYNPLPVKFMITLGVDGGLYDGVLIIIMP
jgi:hypothetical protein